ncbi:hypothetical protein NIES2101_40955 [Calothrix sp. HK-06]|nr:hypothetical protein NIES2101_40955 [Calothrix sp. HK-06]
MKFNLIHTSVLTMAAITSILCSIGIAGAQIQRNIPVNPDLRVNPKVFETLSPKVYGEVQVTFGRYASKGNLKCENLSVVLYSDEKQPTSPKPGELNLPGAPIFAYSSKLSGNLNNGKCSYSLTFPKKYVGKKAWLDFSGGGDYTDGAKAIILQGEPLKMDTTVTFGRIG